MAEINETALDGYPNIIPFDSSQKIIEQMKKDICKIKIGEEQGTGFFCKIPFPNSYNMLPVFITNNHVINEDFLFKDNNKFTVRIKEEKKEKEIYLNNRMKYTNKDFDITIIEIYEKDEIKSFLDLDDKIINDIIDDTDENHEFVDETIYIIQYPEGQLSVSYGILQKIFEDKKYNFIHKCSTRRGSSGSPILNSKNKIIGIHKKGTNKYNIGTFLNSPIKEFIKQYYFNKDNKFQNNIYKNLYSELEESLKINQKINSYNLFPKVNKINWGKGGKRGGFEYKPPYGWIGIGLNVMNKYDNKNSDWLGNDGNKNEWAVAYWGIGGETIKYIAKGKFLAGRMKIYKDYDDIFHPGMKVGSGVIFFQNPKRLDELAQLNEKNNHLFDINGKKYVIALMVRVKPDKIRCPNGDDNLNDIWVLNSSNDEVRPYRILFKEIKNMK